MSVQQLRRKPATQKVLTVSEIEIGERLRPASATAVEAMIHSIQKRGILSPIQVLKHKGGYRLLDGLHRLTAAMSMGMPEVPAIVQTCSVREGLNIEVEANLARASLTPLDLGLFLARQKELYEEEHPETKRAAMARNVLHDACTDKMSVQSFAANAADALGKDERTVRRLIAAAKSLKSEEVRQLRAAPSQIKLQDLQFLAKCGEAKDRAAICKALSKGTAKSAKAALDEKRGKNKRPELSDADKKAIALMDAWARAPKKAKKTFVREFQKELQAVLGEFETENPVVHFKAQVRSNS